MVLSDEQRTDLQALRERLTALSPTEYSQIGPICSKIRSICGTEGGFPASPHRMMFTEHQERILPLQYEQMKKRPSSTKTMRFEDSFRKAVQGVIDQIGEDLATPLT